MTRQGCREKKNFPLFGARRQARAIGPPLAGAGSLFYLKLYGLSVAGKVFWFRIWVIWALCGRQGFGFRVWSDVGSLWQARFIGFRVWGDMCSLWQVRFWV